MQCRGTKYYNYSQLLPSSNAKNIFILFLGVSCPRAGTNSDRQRQQQQPAEPYGQEAMNFTKELILQREVDVEVENCDKGGNFIGWMFVDGRNLAVSLVEVHNVLILQGVTMYWE